MQPSKCYYTNMTNWVKAIKVGVALSQLFLEQHKKLLNEPNDMMKSYTGF